MASRNGNGRGGDRDGENRIARAEPVDMATAGRDAQTDVQVIDASTLAVLNESEIAQQVATARRYPRSLSKFRANLVGMATIDQATADSCIYAIPRGGKTIEGPSVRFAEMVASTWGNIRWGGRVIEANERFVVAQGFAHDLETNSAIAIEVRRRVTPKKDRSGRPLPVDEDMIQLACASSVSIARRNALLATVPRALCQAAYDAADNCVATGDDFQKDRENAIKAFEKYGAKPQRIYAALGVEGPDDITGQQLRKMRRLFAALRDGSPIDEVLRPAAELEAESRGRTSTAPSDFAGSTEKPQADPTTTTGPGDDSQAP